MIEKMNIIYVETVILSQIKVAFGPLLWWSHYTDVWNTKTMMYTNGYSYPLSVQSTILLWSVNMYVNVYNDFVWFVLL